MCPKCGDSGLTDGKCNITVALKPVKLENIRLSLILLCIFFHFKVVGSFFFVLCDLIETQQYFQDTKHVPLKAVKKAGSQKEPE